MSRPVTRARVPPERGAERSQYMWQLGVSPIELVARTVIIYFVFFGALRLTGQRDLGQFTLFDIALLLLVANALQPAMTGPDQSVTGGIIIVATIFVLNKALAEARIRIGWVHDLLEFEPRIIGRDGRWIERELERQGLDDADLGEALRQHGLERVDQMKLAVLEEDGSISVIGTDDEAASTALRRRRRRYRHSGL